MAGFFDTLKSSLEQSGAFDPFGYARYGVSTADKEAKARGALGGIPGAPTLAANMPFAQKDDILDRDAAGYLMGKNYGGTPAVARTFQELADVAHEPFQDWDVQKYAGQGTERGIADYQKEQEAIAAEQEAERRRGQPASSFFRSLITGGYR